MSCQRCTIRHFYSHHNRARRHGLARILVSYLTITAPVAYQNFVRISKIPPKTMILLNYIYFLNTTARHLHQVPIGIVLNQSITSAIIRSSFIKRTRVQPFHRAVVKYKRYYSLSIRYSVGLVQKAIPV